jgi:hypothetical protein
MIFLILYTLLSMCLCCLQHNQRLGSSEMVHCGEHAGCWLALFYSNALRIGPEKSLQDITASLSSNLCYAQVTFFMCLGSGLKDVQIVAVPKHIPMCILQVLQILHVSRDAAQTPHFPLDPLFSFLSPTGRGLIAPPPRRRSSH